MTGPAKAATPVILRSLLSCQSREIFKFAIEQSTCTLARNTSERWAFSMIAQLSLQNWDSPLFFERKMPCKHAPKTELKVISSGWICSSEKLYSKCLKNGTKRLHFIVQVTFKSQESLETCSQIRHVISNLQFLHSPSGLLILWRDLYSFIGIKQSLWVIRKLVLWQINALKMQQCCKANCHCFPFSQALITPERRAETTGLLSHRMNEETILFWSCRMWSYHE